VLELMALLNPISSAGHSHQRLPARSASN